MNIRLIVLFVLLLLISLVFLIIILVFCFINFFIMKLRIRIVFSLHKTQYLKVNKYGGTFLIGSYDRVYKYYKCRSIFFINNIL